MKSLMLLVGTIMLFTSCAKSVRDGESFSSEAITDPLAGKECHHPHAANKTSELGISHASRETEYCRIVYCPGTTSEADKQSYLAYINAFAGEVIADSSVCEESSDGDITINLEADVGELNAYNSYSFFLPLEGLPTGLAQSQVKVLAGSNPEKTLEVDIFAKTLKYQVAYKSWLVGVVTEDSLSIEVRDFNEELIKVYNIDVSYKVVANEDVIISKENVEFRRTVDYAIDLNLTEVANELIPYSLTYETAKFEASYDRATKNLSISLRNIEQFRGMIDSAGEATNQFTLKLKNSDGIIFTYKVNITYRVFEEGFHETVSQSYVYASVIDKNNSPGNKVIMGFDMDARIPDGAEFVGVTKTLNYQQTIDVFDRQINYTLNDIHLAAVGSYTDRFTMHFTQGVDTFDLEVAVSFVIMEIVDLGSVEERIIVSPPGYQEDFFSVWSETINIDFEGSIPEGHVIKNIIFVSGRSDNISRDIDILNNTKAKFIYSLDNRESEICTLEEVQGSDEFSAPDYDVRCDSNWNDRFYVEVEDIDDPNNKSRIDFIVEIVLPRTF